MRKNNFVYLALLLMAVMCLVSPALAVQVDGNTGSIDISFKVSFNKNHDYVWGEDADGSEENPYVISTSEGLSLIHDYITKSGAKTNATKYFVLSQDIAYSEEDSFTPIGNASYPFKGTFDGNGHTISGITLNSDDTYAGVFGYLDGATVRNVTVENCNFSGNYAGGIAAVASGDTIITNCAVVSVDIIASEDAGGIAGHLYSSDIVNCLTVGGSVSSVSGDLYAGNIAGYVEGNAITLSYYTTDREAIGTSSGDITITAGRGYAVSLDNSGSATLSFVLDESVDIESTDLVQASGQMLVFREKVFASPNTVITFTAVTDEGYSLVSVSSSYDTLSQSGSTYTFNMPADDVTITASAIPITYTISYDLDGGEISEDNPTSYAIESDDITLTNPTKTGYTFTGWIGTSLDAATLTVTITSGSIGNREYTATYTPIIYTISYDLDGGEVSQDNPTSYTIESSDITLTNPTKSGYTFTGWTGTSLDAATLTVTITSGSIGNREYTANYEINSSGTTSDSDDSSDSDDVINNNNNDTPAESQTVTVSEDEVMTMSEEALKTKFGSQENINVKLTGTVANLSAVLTAIASVREDGVIETLDLSSADVENVVLGSVSVQNLNIAGSSTIKSVDVTGNTSLETLDVSVSSVISINANGCTALEEVNIEGCEELEYVDFSNTGITELNAANCKKLKTILCSSCNISSVNLDSCDVLEEVNFTGNRLPMLDMSRYNRSDSSLRTLMCSGQNVRGKTLSRSMNFYDFLRSRGNFAISAADDEATTYADRIDDLKAYDNDGDELSVTSFNEETGDLEFSGTPYKMEYIFDTGFNDVSMDVAAYNANYIDDNNNDTKTDDVTGPGDSSGGCYAGFGVWTLLAVMAFMKKR